MRKPYAIIATPKAMPIPDQLENGIGKKYKVTRRIPELMVSETKIYRLKKDATQQFDEWLS